jgi:hypothetical protein
MRGKPLFLALVLALALPVVTQAAPAATISGNYVEFRNADVYTGPCFANSEVGLTGENAVLAWQIAQGGWAGVPLDGLNVVAVVRASATLGDPYANPLPTKTVFLLDSRASEAQRLALVRFAQAQTAGLLDNVVAVESAPISFASARHGYVTLEAGNLVNLTTRTLNENDELCHNEEVFYQPLAAHLVHAMPVVAASSAYRGNHLGVTWNDSGRRSSFVGTFAE